jgi:hypothetical protein
MKDTWRITKSLTNDSHNIPHNTINVETANTIRGKLKAFAVSLAHIFTINPDVSHSFRVSTEQVVNDFLKQPLTDRVVLISVRACFHSKEGLRKIKKLFTDLIGNIICNLSALLTTPESMYVTACPYNGNLMNAYVFLPDKGRKLPRCIE